MADTWQTIEQAAVTLKLSVRTVNRHITAGKLQSRLFEGRREVLVSGAEFEAAFLKPAATTSPSTSSVSAAEPNFSFRPTPASDNQRQPFMADEPNGDYVSGNVRVGAGGPMADRDGGSSAEPSVQDPHRQRVTPEVAVDRPWDMQTMLALKDSFDDNATLAVAAYQTLARSAETQVQSLRKVAFGAWAVVGVMAVGITIAVGWAAVAITSAEKSSGYLKEQLDRARRDNEKLEDRVQAYSDKAEATSATLKEQQDRSLADQYAGLRADVDQIKAGRLSDPIGRSFSASPSAVGGAARLPPPSGTPVGAPATQTSRSTTGGAAGSRPATVPSPRLAPVAPFGAQ